MNILAPFSKADEVEKLIKAGANELYCGVYSEKLRKTFSILTGMNRHDIFSANLKNFKELKGSIEVAHSYDVPVFLTMNGLYNQKQLDYAIEEIKLAVKLGVDSIIIADIGFLLSLKKIGADTKICISTGGTAFNSETIEFYKNLNANRITLPRHITTKEIERISKTIKGMELEVFILNSLDANVDGFCTYHHGLKEIKKPANFYFFFRSNELARRILKKAPTFFSDYIRKKSSMGLEGACYLYYDVDVKLLKEESKSFNKKNASQRVKNNFCLNRILGTPCGGCAIYDFNKMGVKSVKIIGRERNISKKVKDVHFIKTLVDNLSKNNSRSQFMEKTKLLYKKIYRQDCNLNTCYYPSVLVGENGKSSVHK